VDQAGDVSVFPLPGVSGEAHEVNNQGVIAGRAGGHAVVWTPAPAPELYAVHELGDGQANSISEPDTNGNVWVVGTSSYHGVLWQVASDGTLLSTTDLEPNASDVSAVDVKVIGDSVFVVGTDTTEPRACCIWEADLNGMVMGRTDLPEVVIRAIALNNDGDVAGWAFNSAGERNGFLYDSSDGSITDLGSLGNNGSVALGVNDSDVVVGFYESYTEPGQGYPKREKDAFVWEDGTMHKLLDQVSDRNFWLLPSAYDVNNSGEIVGDGRWGKRNVYGHHGFLARPEDTGQQPPDAVDDSATTDMDTPVTIDVLANDTDPENDPLDVTGVTQGSNGDVAINPDDTVTYTPNAGFAGTDTFTYTISDGNGGEDTATVSITVSSGMETPLFVYDIRFESKRGNKDWRAVFEIRNDSNGDGMGTPADAVAPGVEITVTFDGVSYTGTTDADGVFRTSWIKDLSSGDHYAEVVDLALADHFWDPLDMDLEGDADGNGLPDEVLSL
jgi:probable HAF family extracellular repeat protein